MLSGRNRPLHRHQCRLTFLPTSILFLTSLLPASLSQSTFNAAFSTLSPLDPATVGASTMSSQTLISKSSPPTLWTTSSSPTPTSTATKETPNPPSDWLSDAGSADGYEQRNESVFNYYFLFLAAFGFLVVIGLWWLHRRRRIRKEQTRRSGHNALARDLDGWVNTRRWMHGAWRHNQATTFVRREEGLNEHGEAPPPYRPKGEATVDAGITHDVTTSLAIPLRTLPRDEAERSRPPGYEEVAPHERDVPLDTQPDISTSRISQSDATTHPDPSARIPGG